MPATEDGEQVVFVYGTLRRGASNAAWMEGAAHVAKGEVAGRLLLAEGFPCLVAGTAREWVTGDVFQVSRGHLEKLDRILADEAGSDGILHRRERTVYPEGRRNAAWTAWVWEWEGDATGLRVLPTGDWLDIERPRRPPFLTLIALFCFPGLPAGLVAGDVSFGRWDYMIPSLLIFSPVLACIATKLGQDLREKWEPLRYVVFYISLLVTVPLVAALILQFRSLFH